MAESINQAFQSLIFTKAETKGGYATYAAGVASGLAGGFHRYVLAFVPENLAKTNQAKIHELSWQNIQTRQLTYSYRMKPQSWNIPRDFNDIILSVIRRSNEESVYASHHFPFEVRLLHDTKKKTQYQFNNKLNLSAALSTFACVIDYKEPIQSNIPSTSNWFAVEEQGYTLL